MVKCKYSGLSDIGYSRKENEDYISVIQLDENNTFAVIADGAGSLPNLLQPAIIAVTEINTSVKRTFEADKAAFIANSELFIREAVHSANRILGAFKTANEELYSGFACSVSCCLISNNESFSFVHCGNTRIYLIRVNQKSKEPSIRQLTVDQTKAQELVDKGKIDSEMYYSHPDRLQLISGLGFLAEPTLQSFSCNIKAKDIFLLSTDGIHYAIRPEYLMQLVLNSKNCDEAAQSLIKGALTLKYPDNMSTIMMFADAE